jgi:hypothetical protein
MKQISLLILTILITGCQNVPTKTPTQAATIFIATSSFPTIPSPTDTIESTATATNPYLQIQCLSVQDSLPPGLSSDGMLIMQNINERHQISDVYGLDLQTNNLFVMNQPWEDVLEGEVSPDGKWFFYRRYIWDDIQKKYTKIEIIVASLDGQLLQLTPEVVLPDNPDWFFPNNSPWINNAQLLLRISDPGSKNVVTDTVIIWDPFTGMKKIIRPDFPEIYNTGGIVKPNWGYGVALYDPTLTKVFYLTGDGISSVGFKLWDMEKDSVIVSDEFFNDFDVPPRWSPDGSKLALEEYREIFTVEPDGLVNQLTNLGESLNFWSLKNLVWSPDGNHIAFSLWNNPTGDSEKAGEYNATLAIADTKTGVVTDTCIPVGDDPIDMFWSPNGTQLVVKDESVEDYNRLILVDLEKGIAAQIGEFMEPFGWMISQE